MKIKVFGIGNILRADDAVGVRIVERLQKQSVLRDDQAVELISVEMGGLDIIPMLEDADIGVIVDAIHTHDIPPGEARVATSEQVKLKFNPKPTSFHQSSITDALLLLDALNRSIPLYFVIVSPASYEHEVGLTPVVENNLGNYCEMVENLVSDIKQGNVQLEECIGI